MRRELFTYELPADRIAEFPADERDLARVCVCSRTDRSFVLDRRIRDLPELLEPGDVLVLNDTRVLPYRLIGRRPTGGRVECLILEREGSACVGLLKPSRKLHPGAVIALEGGSLELCVGARLGAGRHEFELRSTDGDDIAAALERVGRAPLPPYIRRSGHEDVERDRARYQTVFAVRPGAVAAPTAGLHLTSELIDELASAGIDCVRVTLHVGEGTFEPIRCADIEAHEMHAEHYDLTAAAAARLERAKADGGRVLCVGTTSARVVETCFDPEAGRLRPGAGQTRLFLYPGRGPRFLDGLLTNFHLPESTLLLLVASILGTDHTLELYDRAIREGYRFYSFGDAMLILP